MKKLEKYATNVQRKQFALQNDGAFKLLKDQLDKNGTIYSL